MESLPKIRHSHISLNHSLLQRGSQCHRSSFPTPFSSLSPPLPPFSPIRVSSSPSPSPKPQNPLTLNLLLPPLVKPTCIAIAATAFFFMRLHSPPVAFASTPVAPPESAESETLPNESATEEQLRTTDTDALQSLLQTKIRALEINEAIRVLDRLSELEPEESEYPLLKAHLHMRYGEHELAANVFEELLHRDPFHVEAYRGLLMLTSETNKPTEELLKRIEEAAAKVCEEQERDSDVRDLKLLIAQIKVINGDLSEALKVYEELVKEEPKDFRPYLCQGIVYSMLRKKDEAEKQFEKYRALVPEDHPYKHHFEENTQFLERRGVGGAKS
ncbi:protein SLOW GREEN 1, chloroplastic [Glycine soja]|uniref:Protein SLOW GREEN 1, chloroplastic n=1 Tax=Glycine soja TaxID=3848 RepID=A0A0B2SXK1_GLYSO|nr:protein SLOW GREEN 1, chloroplastic-like [Glycine soja]KAG4959443.1 hypothetical protein JHK87_036076 [Glycine soja]KHN49002.1 hypothetical protein glysoja_025379 [Glycine soja]RZB72350.1 protein SLOW GREEN 1, chloroplastic [Glycine soja]